MLTRRHALALLAMLVLVWCQIAASAQPGAFFRLDGAGVVSAATVTKAADMAGMVGCQGASDEQGLSTSHCASDHATSDHAKVPVIAALPPALPFALVYAVERGPVELVRYRVPQGRGPPRSRLCCWLI
ncbi:hypothetical protein [Cognatilysobacter terrigena]|uniref:hypothetical protein n=1 Tax=Cognatilysobacter terrigena TaxID=2488749 RepID=UPI001060D740|nr:hypothetical protein [Lysobacter terrigena]